MLWCAGHRPQPVGWRQACPVPMDLPGGHLDLLSLHGSCWPSVPSAWGRTPHDLLCEAYGPQRPRRCVLEAAGKHLSLVMFTGDFPTCLEAPVPPHIQPVAPSGPHLYTACPGRGQGEPQRRSGQLVPWGKKRVPAKLSDPRPIPLSSASSSRQQS